MCPLPLMSLGTSSFGAVSPDVTGMGLTHPVQSCSSSSQSSTSKGVQSGRGWMGNPSVTLNAQP